MSQQTTARYIITCLALAFLVIPTGCGPGQSNRPIENPDSTPTEQAALAPTSQTPTAPPTEAPLEPGLPEIIHETMPGEPLYTQRLPEECNTGFNFNRAGYRVRPPCDSWGINLLERPVSRDLSNFYHYIDILSARVGSDGDWFYASLDLFGAGVPEDDTPYTYFFEIDLDQNGRGDLLIAVGNLSLYTTEWSVAGVRAWQDQNGDVGGPTAVRPDSQGGDGYETLLFDQGLGEDPDLAWARRSPDAYQRVEFAFKPSLLQGKASFLWWAGAQLGSFAPGAFDLIDSTAEDSLYTIDTTCGWAYGGQSGYNVKFCYVDPGPTKAPEEQGCIQPPHPDLQNNCWWWDEAACQWICIN